MRNTSLLGDILEVATLRLSVHVNVVLCPTCGACTLDGQRVCTAVRTLAFLCLLWMRRAHLSDAAEDPPSTKACVYPTPTTSKFGSIICLFLKTCSCILSIRMRIRSPLPSRSGTWSVHQLLDLPHCPQQAQAAFRPCLTLDWGKCQ